jgi:hypothetical protein
MITTRRRFIQSTVVLSAVPWATVAQSQLAEARSSIRPERFVYDEGYPEPVDVARRVSTTGLRVSAVRGDLTDLWYNELDMLWKSKPVPLAGFTTRQELFVLETLAADHRMRLVYRGQHGLAIGARAVHSFAGPDAMVSDIAPAAHAATFADTLAAAILRCPADTQPTVVRDVTSSDLLPSQRREVLFSWIIAPRMAAA